MDTKFVILILIASILTMAVYSSSINFVSAVVKSGVATVCSFSSDGNTASCSTPTRTLFCTYNTTTEKWSCHPEKTGSAIPNDRTGSETLFFDRTVGRS